VVYNFPPLRQTAVLGPIEGFYRYQFDVGVYFLMKSQKVIPKPCYVNNHEGHEKHKVEIMI